MITSLFSTGESSPRRALRSLLFFIDRGVPSLKVFGLLIFGLPPFSILISRSYHGHTRFHFDTECRSFFCLTFLFLFSFTVLFFLNFRVNNALSVSGTGPCAPKPFFVYGHGGLLRRRCPSRTGVPMPYNTVQSEPKGVSTPFTTSVIPCLWGPTCLRYHYPTRSDHCRDWVICVPRYPVTIPSDPVASPLGSEPCLPG